MNKIVLKAENISKQYRLGQLGTGTISHDLNRWWHKARGKDDPYLQIGDTNDRSVKGESEYVWSLKDINFDIKQGEAVGIIGKNGAGKSTLLKILSQVTTATSGKVKIRGRIAALLEVGTGFHHELTGRENIFLNGAILGMTKIEIASKFDEIVDFSGIEKYIDTPVKRYSSGMMVRLGFAVAAHLESEILILDEVLAVGDAEFQKKCLGKMNDITASQGRAILFVSHNMAAIKQFCTKGIYLKNGCIDSIGSINTVCNNYLSSNINDSVTNIFIKQKIENKDIEVIYAELLGQDKKTKGQFEISEEITIKIKILCKTIIPNTYAYVVIKDNQEEVFIESDSFDCLPNSLENLKIGENVFELKISPNILPHGDFQLYLSLSSTFSNNFMIDIPGDILSFSIIDTQTKRGYNRKANTSALLKWESILC
jgi:lipopolysaccharide transport system ATP-binding protein